MLRRSALVVLLGVVALLSQASRGLADEFCLAPGMSVSVSTSTNGGKTDVKVTVTGEPAATAKIRVTVYGTYEPGDGHTHTEQVATSTKERNTEGPDVFKFPGLDLSPYSGRYVYVEALDSSGNVLATARQTF